MALTPADPPISSESCAIAYKEWAGVCRALEKGRQTILLRKGGIAESGGVFHPEYTAFWMYPTKLHEAQQGLRDATVPSDVDAFADAVRLDLLAVVESVTLVDRSEIALGLSEFHVWTEETIRKRFAYRTPGIWVLGVRVHRRSNPWKVPISSTHAGCRTWIPLVPPLATSGMIPVLSDAVAAAAREALSSALAQPIGAG